MINIPKAPKPANPVLLDRVLAHLQDEFINKLGWLDYAFGRAQRLVTKRERKEHFYPGIYIGKNEYLNVLPGQNLGNRIFFIAEDPQQIEFTPRMYNTIKSPVSLILWYDLSSIYKGSNERNTEEIKQQILRVLTDTVMPSGSRIEPIKIYEQAENIFSEYSLKEIDTQFLMQPYAGLRIEMLVSYREQCK